MSAFENIPNNQEVLPEKPQIEELEKPFKVFQGETVLIKRSDGSIENDWMVSETPFPEEEFIKVYKKDPENPENTMTKSILRNDLESINGSEIDFSQVDGKNINDLIYFIYQRSASGRNISKEFSADNLVEMITKVRLGKLDINSIPQITNLHDSISKAIDFEKEEKTQKQVEQKKIQDDYIENVSELNNYSSFEELKKNAENSPALKQILENLRSEIDDEFYQPEIQNLDEIPEENREEYIKTLERNVKEDLIKAEKIRHIAYGKGTHMGKRGVPEQEDFNTLYDYGDEKTLKDIGYVGDFYADEEFINFLKGNYHKIKYKILQEKFPFLKEKDRLESELDEAENSLSKQEYDEKCRLYRKNYQEYSFLEMSKIRKIPEFSNEHNIEKYNFEFDPLELQKQEESIEQFESLDLRDNNFVEQEISQEKPKLDMLDVYKEYLAYQDVTPGPSLEYALDENGELKEGSSDKKYTESLSNILDSERAESLETVKGTIRNYYEHIKNNLGLEDSVYGQSDSWIYWDIAKQDFMVQNPDSSKPEYLLADPLDFENSQESRELIQQIADRHIGWEIANPYSTFSVESKKMPQRVLDLLEKAERNPGSKALSSLEYSELGQLIRKVNNQENIFS